MVPGTQLVHYYPEYTGPGLHHQGCIYQVWWYKPISLQEVSNDSWVDRELVVSLGFTVPCFKAYKRRLLLIGTVTWARASMGNALPNRHTRGIPTGVFRAFSEERKKSHYCDGQRLPLAFGPDQIKRKPRESQAGTSVHRSHFLTVDACDQLSHTLATMTPPQYHL